MYLNAYSCGWAGNVGTLSHSPHLFIIPSFRGDDSEEPDENLVNYWRSSILDLTPTFPFPYRVMSAPETPPSSERRLFVRDHRLRIWNSGPENIDWSPSCPAWRKLTTARDRFKLLDENRHWLCFCSPIGYGNKTLWDQAAYIRRRKSDLVVKLEASELPLQDARFGEMIFEKLSTTLRSIQSLRTGFSEQAVRDLTNSAFHRHDLSLFIYDVEQALASRDIGLKLNALRKFLADHVQVGCYIDCTPFAVTRIYEELFASSSKWQFVQCESFIQNQSSEWLKDHQQAKTLWADFHIPGYLKLLRETPTASLAALCWEATLKVLERAGRLQRDVKADDVRRFVEELAFSSLFQFEDAELDRLEYAYSLNELPPTSKLDVLLGLVNSTALATVFINIPRQTCTIRWRSHEIRNLLAAMHAARYKRERITTQLQDDRTNVNDKRFEQVARLIQELSTTHRTQEVKEFTKLEIPESWRSQYLPSVLHGLADFKNRLPTEDGLIIKFDGRAALLVCSLPKSPQGVGCISFGTKKTKSEIPFIQMNQVTPTTSSPLFKVCYDSGQWTLCTRNDPKWKSTIWIGCPIKLLEPGKQHALQAGQTFVDRGEYGRETIVDVAVCRKEYVLLRSQGLVDLLLIRPDVLIEAIILKQLDGREIGITVSKTPGSRFKVSGDCLSVDNLVPDKWIEVT